MTSEKYLEQYVSFETAKLLKEKGFPQDTVSCNTCYKYNGNFCNNARSMSGVDREICYIAPTKYMALKWLKKNYHLHIEIIPIKPYVCDNDRMVPSDKVTYTAKILRIDKWNKYLEEFDTLRPSCQSESEFEVIENAIKYCLEKII